VSFFSQRVLHNKSAHRLQQYQEKAEKVNPKAPHIENAESFFLNA
jgi:hypothetical protein